MYFSDESKFNLFGSDGINYVRRFQGEKFNAKCTKKLLNLEVAALWYLVCFHTYVLPALIYFNVKNPIFVQDNAPCHKAKSVLNFLKEEKVQLLDWPAQSPDINPIKNLWKILMQRVMAKNPTNTKELWLKLQKN